MGRVEDAVELAREAFKHDMELGDNSPDGQYRSAAFWQEMSICSSIKARQIWINDKSFVESADGEPMLVMLGGPGDWCEVYDDEKGKKVIAKAAAKDRLAHNVLCSVAAGYVEAGCPMPRHLRAYIAKVLFDETDDRSRHRRGPNPYGNHNRDLAIASAVYEVVTQDDFAPTRNSASDHESACSIVARALKQLGIDLGEKSVEAIWKIHSWGFKE